MLRSRNFLFSPLWCSSLIQVEFHFFGDKTRWGILNPIVSDVNVLVQKKTSPTWSALQVSGGAQVLTGADKDLLLSNALIALKESWLGRLQWDVIPVFVCCFFFFSAINVSALFLVYSWLQRWFLCSCVGTGEKLNRCFNQYIHFTLFIVCDLSSLQAARIYDKQVHLYREEKHILRGFPWISLIQWFSCQL